MTRTLKTRHLSVVWLLLALAFALAQNAFAAQIESFVRIENRWKPDEQIHLQAETPASSPAQPGWWSADWTLEPAGDGYVRIKNRYRNTYLHTQNAKLEAGAMESGWQSAMWQLEPVDSGFYKLKNRSTGDYLNNQNGALEVGKIMPGWFSAMWKLSGYMPAPDTKTAIPGSDAVRTSYDTNYYGADDTATNENKYKWTGSVPFERTIYNPLDGGVLLKYKQTSKPNNADGCSGPTTEPWRTLFLQACLAHDTNYDAPFDLAGFPRYKGGASTGKEIADYLFLKDMLETKKTQDALSHSLIETAAATWYRSVLDFGGFRGNTENKTVLEKGGAIAVKNNGAYLMGMRVKWISPQGNEKVEEVMNHGGRAAVIPLSVGARNIRLECWSVAGKTIFTRSFETPGMYAFTVTGTSLNTDVADNLADDPVAVAINQVGTAVKTAVEGEKTPAGARAIKFNNQAGYVASMTVTYFVMEKVGGATIPIVKTLSTPQISLGFTRPLMIPKDVAPNFPITVTIDGVGTIAKPVFTTTVPASFTGELCFKSWATIFDAKGGPCD